MGVPSFYRWLADKYPNIVVNAVEEKGNCVDTSFDNPNRMEFDHLYLDMNGIIHPCFHPDDNAFPPTTFEEVFNRIFEYIDRIFSIVRPRKLLFMAIDGVAPRAKMNQQRARRFRTAKDQEIAEIEEEKLRKQFMLEGKMVLPKKQSEVSDSNVITPGTKFMHILAKELQKYIRLRISNDPGWKNIKVILSDANVPGEGEHKIMSFIRLQRTLPEYIRDTRHCLYGLDADLIMLALATHEVHFSILRENVIVQELKPSCESALEFSLHEEKASLANFGGWCKQKPSEPGLETSHDEAVSSSETHSINRTISVVKKPYQFLHVWILREYLELDMEITNPPEKFERDFERTVDDFIFMCFFAGNDFLPHMPTLEIHEGAIDLLMHVYKKEFKNMGGYLVDMQRVEDKKAGFIKFKRVEKFILSVGSYEEKIFQKRSELRQRKLRRILSEFADARAEEDNLGPTFEMNTQTINSAVQNGKAPSFVASATITDEIPTSSSGIDGSTADNSEIFKNTMELKEKMKEHIRKISDVLKDGGIGSDKVKLGVAGWQERYYKEKFSVDSPEDIASTKKAVVEKYTEGLCWVLLYYFSGVPSWTWYYPHHYGPFASDLKGLANVKLNFQKGLPFKPFDQLMGVLPPRSAHALPVAYQLLMTDEHSAINYFYPADFEVDTDGKRYMWQGICKLPFIEEKRLLDETKKLEMELNEDERMRNAESVDRLFVGSSSKLHSQILSLYEDHTPMKQKDAIKIDASGGINGFMRLMKSDDSNAVDSDGAKDIKDRSVLSVFYEPPPFSVHIPRLLTKPPDKTISDKDIMAMQLWHEYQGSRPSTISIQYQGRQMKEGHSLKYRSTNSPPGMIYKGAGSGWASCRGKMWTSTPGPESQNGYTRTVLPFVHVQRVASLPYSSSSRELEGPSSSLDARTRGGHHLIPTCERNFNPTVFMNHRPYNSNQHWKAIGYCVGEPRGIEDLRISEPIPGLRPYGRAQPVNNNLLSPRPCGRVQSMNNNVWSPRPCGRAQSMNNNLRSPRPRGRAQSMNNNFWQTRTSSGSNSSPQWRHGVQPTAALPDCGWDGWQNGSIVNTDQAWQPHNQSPAATASIQARGRGQNVANTSTTSWNSRYADTPGGS